MSALWTAWVRRCARVDDARPLAIVRIAVAVVLLLDLAELGRQGLVPTLFQPEAAGGFATLATDHAWIAAVPHGETAAWILAMLAMGCVALGVATRPALLIGLLAYAQLGHLFPPGDRAIDRILRTALLCLLGSQSHYRLSLTGVRADRIPAWPADLIRLLLVNVYLTSGIGKLYSQPEWLGTTGTPVLYRIMVDPLAAHVDPHAALAWFVPLRVLGWGTIALELSSPLILTRWSRWWAMGGVAMHLGIAATMDLGIFPWGMLALYPVLWGGRTSTPEVSSPPNAPRPRPRRDPLA